MLIVGDRDAPKAVSSRERALLMDLEEVLQDLTDVRVEHALSRALVAELQEQVGKAAGAEELEAELKRSNDRLLGVQFEIQRLATGAINIPSIPHELKEHIRRIHALAHPAEKG